MSDHPELDRFAFVGACESLLATSSGCSHSKEDLHSLFDFLTLTKMVEQAPAPAPIPNGVSSNALVAAGATTMPGASVVPARPAEMKRDRVSPAEFDALLKIVGQLPKWDDELKNLEAGTSSNSPLPRIRMWLLKHSWIMFDLRKFFLAEKNTTSVDDDVAFTREEFEQKLVAILPTASLPKAALTELWRMLAVERAGFSGNTAGETEKVCRLGDFIAAVLDARDYREHLKKRLLKIVFRTTKDKPGSLLERLSAADASGSGLLPDEQVRKVLTAMVGHEFVAKEDVRVLATGYRQGELVVYKDLLSALRDEHRAYLEHVLHTGMSWLQQAASDIPFDYLDVTLDAPQLRVLLTTKVKPPSSSPTDPLLSDEFLADFTTAFCAGLGAGAMLRTQGPVGSLARLEKVVEPGKIPAMLDRLLPKVLAVAGGPGIDAGILAGQMKGSTTVAPSGRRTHLCPLLFFELAQTMRRNDIPVRDGFSSLDQDAKGYLNFADLKQAMAAVLGEESVTAEELGVGSSYTLDFAGFEKATTFNTEAFANALPAVFSDQPSDDGGGGGSLTLLDVVEFRRRMVEEQGVPAYEVENFLKLIYASSVAGFPPAVVDRATCETFVKANGTAAAGGAGSALLGIGSKSQGGNIFRGGLTTKNLNGSTASVGGAAASAQEEDGAAARIWNKLHANGSVKAKVAAFAADEDVSGREVVDAAVVRRFLDRECGLTDAETSEVTKTALALTLFYPAGLRETIAIAAPSSPGAGAQEQPPPLAATVKAALPGAEGGEHQDGPASAGTTSGGRPAPPPSSVWIRRLTLLSLIERFDEHLLDVQILQTDLTPVPSGTLAAGGAALGPRYFVRYACHGSAYHAQTTALEAGTRAVDFRARHSFALHPAEPGGLGSLLLLPPATEEGRSALRAGLVLEVVRVLPQQHSATSQGGNGSGTNASSATGGGNNGTSVRFLSNTGNVVSNAGATSARSQQQPAQPAVVGQCVFDADSLKEFFDGVAGGTASASGKKLLGAAYERAVPFVSSDGTRLGSVSVRLFYRRKKAQEASRNAPKWTTTFEGANVLSHQLVGASSGAAQRTSTGGAFLMTHTSSAPNTAAPPAGAIYDPGINNFFAQEQHTATSAGFNLLDQLPPLLSATTGLLPPRQGQQHSHSQQLSSTNYPTSPVNNRFSKTANPAAFHVQSRQNTVSLEVNLSRGELNHEVFRKLCEQWYKSSLQNSASSSVLDIESVRVMVRVGLFSSSPKLQGALGGGWVNAEPKPMSLAELLLGWAPESSGADNAGPGAGASPIPDAGGNSATATPPAAATAKVAGPVAATPTTASAVTGAITGKAMSAMSQPLGAVVGAENKAPPGGGGSGGADAGAAAKAAVASLATSSVLGGAAASASVAKATPNAAMNKPLPPMPSSIPGAGTATASSAGQPRTRYTPLDFQDFTWQSSLLPPTPSFFDALKSDTGVLEFWLLIEQSDELHQLERPKAVEVCLASDVFPLQPLHAQLDPKKAQSVLSLVRKATFRAGGGGPGTGAGKTAAGTAAAGGFAGGAVAATGPAGIAPLPAGPSSAVAAVGGAVAAGSSAVAVSGATAAQQQQQQQLLAAQANQLGEFLASVDLKLSVSLPGADVMSLLYLTGIAAPAAAGGTTTATAAAVPKPLPAVPKPLAGAAVPVGGSQIAPLPPYGTQYAGGPGQPPPTIPGTSKAVAPPQPPFLKDVTGHERKLVLRLVGAVVRVGDLTHGASASGPGTSESGPGIASGTTPGTTYYIEYLTMQGNDATTLRTHRSLPLVVQGFADAPANRWANLGTVSETTTVAFTAKGTTPRPEQVVRVGLKLFQMGRAGSGSPPVCIGEGGATFSADVAAVETAVWGSFFSPPSKQPSSSPATQGKFLLSSQLRLPPLESELRVDPAYTGAPESAMFTTPSKALVGVGYPSGLVFPTYSTATLGAQQKWSWVLGHGPPVLPSAKRLRPPLECVLEVICRVMADEQQSATATTGGGGAAAVQQQAVVNLLNKFQDAGYKRGSPAAPASTAGAAAATTIETTVYDVLLPILPKCLTRGLLAEEAGEGAGAGGSGASSGAAGDSFGATGASVSASAAGAAATSTDQKSAQDCMGTTSSSSSSARAGSSSTNSRAGIKGLLQKVLKEAVPLVHHLREKPMDALLALKVEGCWCVLKQKLFAFVTKNEKPLIWGEFRRLFDLTLAGAGGEDALPESYWALLRNHPTWWGAAAAEQGWSSNTGVFDVWAFVSDMDFFPEMQSALEREEKAKAAEAGESEAKKKMAGAAAVNGTSSLHMQGAGVGDGQLQQNGTSSTTSPAPPAGVAAAWEPAPVSSIGPGAAATTTSSMVDSPLLRSREIKQSASSMIQSMQEIEWLEQKLQNNLAQLEERVTNIKNRPPAASTSTTSRGEQLVRGDFDLKIVEPFADAADPASPLSRANAVLEASNAPYEQQWQVGEQALPTYESTKLRELHAQNMAELDFLRKKMLVSTATSRGSGGSSSTSPPSRSPIARPGGLAGGSSSMKAPAPSFSAGAPAPLFYSSSASSTSPGAGATAIMAPSSQSPAGPAMMRIGQEDEPTSFIGAGGVTIKKARVKPATVTAASSTATFFDQGASFSPTKNEREKFYTQALSDLLEPPVVLGQVRTSTSTTSMLPTATILGGPAFSFSSSTSSCAATPTAFAAPGPAPASATGTASAADCSASMDAAELSFQNEDPQLFNTQPPPRRRGSATATTNAGPSLLRVSEDERILTHQVNKIQEELRRNPAAVMKKKIGKEVKKVEDGINAGEVEGVVEGNVTSIPSAARNKNMKKEKELFQSAEETQRIFGILTGREGGTRKTADEDEDA